MAEAFQTSPAVMLLNIIFPSPLWALAANTYKLDLLELVMSIPSKIVLAPTVNYLLYFLESKSVFSEI